MARFGDFAAAFAAGLAKGAPEGYKLGLAGRELEETRKYRAAETARKAAADAATAAYRKSRLGVDRDRLAETGRHNLAVEGTAAGEALSRKTRREAQTAQGEQTTQATVAEKASTIRKNAGYDPAFHAAKKADDPNYVIPPDPAAHLFNGSGGAVGATTPAPTTTAPTQAPIDNYSDGAPYSSALGEFWGVEVPIDEEETE